MTIKVTRDSVCAGDSVGAPHEKNFNFLPDARLSDLMNLLTTYLARVAGYCAWAVYWHGSILGYLLCNNGVYAIKLISFDCKISDLSINDIHCRYYSESDAKKLKLD